MLRALPLWGDLFECLTSLATISKTVQAEECFQRECQGETLSGKETKQVFIFSYKIWEEPVVCAKVVFWTEDLIEETTTTKQLQDSNYTILTLIEHDMYVCPHELSPSQSRSSSLRPVLHMLAFRTKTISMSVSPTLNLRKMLPILILTSRTRSSKPQS